MTGLLHEGIFHAYAHHFVDVYTNYFISGTMSPNNPDWQEYADRVFPLFEEAAGGGALLWNFDCVTRLGWSMEGLAEEIGIQWNN